MVPCSWLWVGLLRLKIALKKKRASAALATQSITIDCGSTTRPQRRSDLQGTHRSVSLAKGSQSRLTHKKTRTHKHTLARARTHARARAIRTDTRTHTHTKARVHAHAHTQQAACQLCVDTLVCDMEMWTAGFSCRCDSNAADVQWKFLPGTQQLQLMQTPQHCLKWDDYEGSGGGIHDYGGGDAARLLVKECEANAKYEFRWVLENHMSAAARAHDRMLAQAVLFVSVLLSMCMLARQ